MHFHYPPGTVRALLNTNEVTEATRQALLERLNALPRQPTFFSNDEFVLLQAICDRLIPQDDRPEPVRIADSIDERLSQNKANGWRYDIMPNDGDAYKLGLQGINESAMILHQQPFLNLSGDQQDEVLKAVQEMEAPGKTWEQLPADRFFEELLAEAVEQYYSHPLAQEEIGYVGMADTQTWKRIGLNQLEDREPRAVNGE
ncbi:gluconate 2-dehydrogenase subunit 3 family protein [Spirosoma sp. RP8]|uniref:Gluconate 2-dehydrogenase subunit 3 family protein n=1 Tax=Spirosoma liriopis TaxID=2937440 RepID=A0ABT0HJ90_9BACT|nr:gluconate 2-dehydrogenase subunit 3 family protein [Spirosoma liriopis]MCK8491947.1 gluconate 2-dehydrogenase subunit 3 family protein [Spirosoma liriopis]